MDRVPSSGLRESARTTRVVQDDGAARPSVSVNRKELHAGVSGRDRLSCPDGKLHGVANWNLHGYVAVGGVSHIREIRIQLLREQIEIVRHDQRTGLKRGFE